MREDPRVRALIDRIVADARVPGAARRDALRRELWSHFEEAGTSPEAAAEAVRRFGDEAVVTAGLRRAYRRDYAWLGAARTAAAAVASMVAAVAIQAVANLRVASRSGAWALAPGFSRAVVLSVCVVLGLVAAWEVARRPFNPTRAVMALGAYALACGVAQLLAAGSAPVFATAAVLVAVGYLYAGVPSRAARLLLRFVSFAVALTLVHALVGVAFGPTLALLRGAGLVAVWLSTGLILARCDQVFVGTGSTPCRETT